MTAKQVANGQTKALLCYTQVCRVYIMISSLHQIGLIQAKNEQINFNCATYNQFLM